MSKKKRERKYGSEEHQTAATTTGSEMTRFYWILGAVAVLGVGILAFRAGSSALSETVTEPLDMDLSDPAVLMRIARGVPKGDPAAEITILEFADFQCPGCRAFHAQVKPLVEAEFIATGVAKFVYYDFPLTQSHPNAFLASRAARCADDQGKFWEFHDVLYRQQDSWAGQPTPVGRFESYAGDLGLDAGAFSTCLRGDKHADVVTANMELGNQMQVPRTPTVVIGKGQSVPLRVDGTIDAIRRAVASLQTSTTGR
jgi:protein-disulfide isomerase